MRKPGDSGPVEGEDPDLPGDETFVPLPPVVDREIVVRCAACPADGPCPVCGGPRAAIAMAETISVQSQANLHHNRLRYAELDKARRGEANRYAQSRYRPL